MSTSRRPLRACSSPSPPRTTPKTATEKHLIVSGSTRSVLTRTSSPGRGRLRRDPCRRTRQGRPRPRGRHRRETEVPPDDLLERIVPSTRRARPLHSTASSARARSSSSAVAIRAIVSLSLAGTVARSGDLDEDARLAGGSSPHRRTGSNTATSSTRSPRPSPGTPTTSSSPAPRNSSAPNVTHLVTPVSATLRGNLPGGHLLMCRARRRTAPDTGGRGTLCAAASRPEENEQLDRARFAGPVGGFDVSGDGERGIAIRSALVDGRRARSVRRGRHRRRLRPRPPARPNPAEVQALLAVSFVCP